MNSKASKKDGHNNNSKSSKSLDKEWLSNLPTTGQCNSGTSFGCGTEFPGFNWGYYLTCFDNPKKYEYITGIRFWTNSSYGVGEGVGARISFYYGSKDRGPLLGLGQLPIPFSFNALDVPVTSDPQTTFIEGLNSFTFPAIGVPAAFPPFNAFGPDQVLDGFCIGLTPPARSPSTNCNYPVVPNIGGRTYCADEGLSILTSGSSEGSYLNCNNFQTPPNALGLGFANPATGFSNNGNVQGDSYPGFCIEAEVSSTPFKVTPDIQYGSAFNGIFDQTLYLDKYEPSFKTQGLNPIAIFVHGGGCARGDRKEKAYVDLARYFASNGFVAVSISYRLLSSLPSCRTPGSIDAAGSDVKASIRFIKSMGHEWGVDPTKIFLYGCSAGARAAAWATYVPGNGIDKTNANVETSQNNPKFDAKVTSLFMLSGELYVPHLQCDLYACFDESAECIEPNALVVNGGGAPPGPLNCNYAADSQFNVIGGSSLCDPARSFGCEDVVSKGDTPLIMLHNNPDSLLGTFTVWQVALRQQALLVRKGVSVELIKNNGPGHCTPSPGVPGSAVSLEELLSRARTSLYGSGKGSKSGKSGAHDTNRSLGIEVYPRP